MKDFSISLYISQPKTLPSPALQTLKQNLSAPHTLDNKIVLLNSIDRVGTWIPL